MLPREKIVIITSCFNENNAVIKFIEKLEAILSEVSPHDYTKIAVDKAMADNTVDKLCSCLIRPVNINLSSLKLNYNSMHQEQSIMV
jgi:hypothetical protein